MSTTSFSPSPTDAQFTEAIGFSELGAYDETLRLLDQLPDAEQITPAVALLRSAALAALDRVEESTACLLAIYERGHGCPATDLAVAGILMRLGEAEAAYEHLIQSELRHGPREFLCVVQAITACSLNCQDEAADHLRMLSHLGFSPESFRELRKDERLANFWASDDAAPEGFWIVCRASTGSVKINRDLEVFS